MFRPVLLYTCVAVVCSQHVHDRQFLGPRLQTSSPPPYTSTSDVPSTPEYRPSNDQEYRPPGTPEYRPPNDQEYRPPGTPEYRPPSDKDYKPPSVLEYRPRDNAYEDRPNDYQPNYAYGYEPEQCIPRDGPSEYVPKDYVKRDAQDFGLEERILEDPIDIKGPTVKRNAQDFGLEERILEDPIDIKGPTVKRDAPDFGRPVNEYDNGPTRPSVSEESGYIPEDIIGFRRQFVYLRQKYPGTNLLDLSEYLTDRSSSRDARIFGLPLPGLPLDLPNTFNGVLTSLGINGWPFNSFLNPSSNLFMNPNNNFNLGGAINVPQLLPAFENALPNSLNTRVPGVETCGNSDGVCMNLGLCLTEGGEHIGSCSECQGCASCCKFALSDQSSTNKTISFFQSPGFPDTRRDSYSSSLSIEVREDVSQLLIEFVYFEMPIGPEGCGEDDYLEIISPQSPGGLLGPGNSKFCGLNTDQHIYIDVRPGDLVIMKVVTSGVGFVPLANSPGTDRDDPRIKTQTVFNSGDASYRFNVKITQILTSAPIETVTLDTSNLKLDANLARIYISRQGDIPDYYKRMLAPSGCRQYYMDGKGTIQSFNFDGSAPFPNNLDYTICIRNPPNACGITLSSVKFDIPTSSHGCANGAHAIYGDAACCTTDPSQNHGVVKYIGLDGTSDGTISGTKYKNNQPRFFFCGDRLGKTNLVVSDRKGPATIKVFSDGNSVCRNPGLGFRIKYEINTGTC